MNGKLVPFKNAKVHVLTHALHYSTAVFEGIRCYNTLNGPAIFRLSEHVDRFFNSAKLYGMKMRYTKRQITDAIIRTVKASGLKECYIRPIAYYGYGTMGLTPTLNKVDVSISCWEWKMGDTVITESVTYDTTYIEIIHVKKGDIFRLATFIPFSQEDSYSFTTSLRSLSLPELFL